MLTLAIAALAAGGTGDSGAAFGQSARGGFPIVEHRATARSELREILMSQDSQSSSALPSMHDLLAGFYAARDFRPVWTGSADAREMANEVRAALLEAGRQGLRSADYAATASRWDAPPAEGREAAEYDLSLTRDLIRYSLDVRIGRVRPKDVYKDVGLPPSDFDPIAALTLAAQRHSMTLFLADLPPPYPEYRRLVEALARYRAIAAKGGWSSLPGRGELAPEGSDQQTNLLKTRLAFEDSTFATISKPSGDELKEAVKGFQRRHGLDADGSVGPGTLTALNVPASVRVEQIAANMERWRWLPRTFERRFVRVNVPDESLEFVRDGEVALSSKVIIGRKNSPTPILRTVIYWVVTNPPWDIPDDIAANQFLPQLRKNPNYLAAHNMVLVNGPANDPQGRKIDWNKMAPGHFPYHVVQIPGPSSALGYLMLDSPNDFDVYLHDTPAKNFFASNDREISNGCVRVQQIFPLASLALTNDTEKGMDRLKKTIAMGETLTLALDDPLPLYMVYWTAIAGTGGSIEFRPDRYGRDRRLIEALAGPAKASQSREAQTATLN
jgi:murein L,D-transpeptidase YcbB/YkuD